MPASRAALGGVLASLLCGVAGPLLADTARSEHSGITQRTAREAYFSGFDRDADGRVDVDEYLDYLRAGFDYLDTNRNGRIDDDELPAGARRSVSRERRGHELAVRATFRRLDRDGNGWLDVDELTAPPR